MIRIEKAKVHNLKSIDLVIPSNALTVITGVSGSGKSSLAFDTIHAEGQRRYMESLSSYARQFLQKVEKPDVVSIEGLSPTIAIQQKTVSNNPRSTVGTVTEIYEYFRPLFSYIGKPHCPECGKPVEISSPIQIAQEILKYPDGTAITLMSPVVRGRKGEYGKVFEEFLKEGMSRVRVDGDMWLLDEEMPKLDRNLKHNIEVVIDRLMADKASKEDNIQRVMEAVELSFKMSEGHVLTMVNLPDSDEPFEKMYNENHMCNDCGISLPDIKPRLFSFNAPYGSCSACSGIGHKLVPDPGLTIKDWSLPISKGAIRAQNFLLDGSISNRWLKALSKQYDFSLDTPFKDLSEKAQNVILYGTGDEPVKVALSGRGVKGEISRPYEGLVNIVARRHAETRSDMARRFYESFMKMLPCDDCKGRRLNPAALSVRIAGENIYELSSHTIKELVDFFNNLELTEKERQISGKVLAQIVNRLNFLNDVGLDYLDLNRASGTLSGGEAQRIRLATQIGSALVGITYVLDEPSIGLHPSDNSKLIETLKGLRDLGNTVLVVEHDKEIMFEADQIIDLGPAAGKEGGYLVAQGTPDEIAADKNSVTGSFLSGEDFIPVPKERRKGSGKFIKLKGASHNNLKNIDVDIPLGKLVAVTGVSGSGKSSLVNDTLFPLLSNMVYRTTYDVGAYEKITGLKNIDKVVNIDQSPIGRSSRSNPATYTGVFSYIRDLFAQTKEAKTRGYTPGRFSFNVKGGRCDACEGMGELQIEMHFMPDVYVTCDYCKGQRFNSETLKIKFKGLSIAEVLAMTVDEALEFFEAFTAIKRRLQALHDVGLGYLTLGQPATTLSGGEAQRMKLAAELSKIATGSTLYLLDEPTTGLHFKDIKSLLAILERLVEKGNTVLIIEHNLDVIKVADHIIDLGPKGGNLGGEIVAEGTPEKVAANKKSLTGQYLKQELKQKAKKGNGKS